MCFAKTDFIPICTLQEEWYVHQCFDNMGDHIFSFPPAAGDDFDCNEVAPWQVLYHNGTLNGFTFQGRYSVMLRVSQRSSNVEFHLSKVHI